MDSHQKVVFRLEPDEDGYPPASFEGLWSIPLPNGNLRVDNIPFYVCGISADDEIATDSVDGELQFRALVRPSSHSTFRLMLSNPGDQSAIRAELTKLGCTSEFNQLIGLIAVDIPGDTPIHPFLDYIMDAQAREVLDIEEGALRHSLD